MKIRQVVGVVAVGVVSVAATLGVQAAIASRSADRILVNLDLSRRNGVYRQFGDTSEVL